MKHIFFCAMAILLAIASFSQIKIAVYNPTSNTTRLCGTLDSAYKLASSGDYIYLPGGNFSLNSAIDKKINIIGSGFVADSSLVTGITVVGSFIVKDGAAGGSLEGLHINGNITLDSNANNFKVNYCYINGGVVFRSGCNNLTFRNNYIGGYGIGFPYIALFALIEDQTLGGSISNSFFVNNIISCSLRGSSCPNNLFSNNIFFPTYNYGASLSLFSNSTYQNNVFEMAIGGNDNYSCIFYNNINASPNVNNGNIGSGNLVESFDLTFVNPGNSSTYGYYYNASSDYHLKTTSVGIKAGTDGKDIGLYGGAIPWKDGAMPSNPHISFKNVPTQNDPSGILRVTIKVKAQSN